MFFVVSIKFESFWSFLKLVLAKSGSNLDQSRRSLDNVQNESNSVTLIRTTIYHNSEKRTIRKILIDREGSRTAETD